jgi:hypothetical protein
MFSRATSHKLSHGPSGHSAQPFKFVAASPGDTRGAGLTPSGPAPRTSFMDSSFLWPMGFYRACEPTFHAIPFEGGTWKVA